MSRDTQAFVSACSVCARSKSSHQHLAGPNWPCSHIAVDFITGPPSPPCPPAPWNPWGYCLRPWTSVLIPVVESLLSSLGCNGQPILVTILGQTARLSRPTRTSSQPFVVSQNVTLPTGVFICPGSSTLTTSLSAPLQVFPAQEKEVSVPSVQANLRQIVQSATVVVSWLLTFPMSYLSCCSS